MPRYRLSAAILLICSLFSGNALAVTGSELSGDIVTGLVPLGALTIAYFKNDTEGEKQWWRNTLASQFLNTVARAAFNSTYGERPNGGKYGFPSGHVSFVVSGAAFLQERYGWKYGLPAYLLAGYVASERVRDDKHHWRDVIAASALSYGVAQLFVTPENATHLAPVIGPDFIGLRWQRSF
jgi:membrane-associated phospholipid phosphatase